MNTILSDHRAAITGIVLAGGQGRRMGSRNKALLTWRSRTFIEHILEGLAPQVDALAINANQTPDFAAFGRPVIADPFTESCGPLAGMLAGLEYCRTPLVLFVPCDNPRIAPDLATRLYEALHDSTASIAYAASPEGHHYLYALLRVELLGSLRDFLHSGQRAVRHWYAGQHCCAVDFSDRAECFSNINTETDLGRLPQ